MTPISEYERQIGSLDIENSLERNITSLQEAKDAQKLCRDYQQQLRQIKKSVSLDIKTIRAEYRDKIANAGSVIGGAFSLFGKKGVGGSVRAEAKRGMTREREDIIAPFEEIKLLIDNYIYDIDKIKNQVAEYILQARVGEKKAKEEEKKRSTPPASSSGSRFCTSCGARSAKAHQFCAQCGVKLD